MFGFSCGVGGGGLQSSVNFRRAVVQIPAPTDGRACMFLLAASSHFEFALQPQEGECEREG